MSMDARARRAGEGVVATARGVDVATRLAGLKREHGARRRHRGVALGLSSAVAALVVLWVTVGVGSGTRSGPAVSTPSPSPSGSARTVVGSHLRPEYSATVPPGWHLDCDCVELTMSKPGILGSLRIEARGYLVKVYDPRSGGPVRAPADLVAWARSNPWLEDVGVQSLTVDGRPATELSVRVRTDVPRSAGDLLPFLTDDASRGLGVDLDYLRLARGETGYWVLIDRGEAFQVVAGRSFVTGDMHVLADLNWGLTQYLDSIRLPKPDS